MMNAAIQKQEPGQVVPMNESASMMAMIAKASADPNVDIDKLERLMAMKERMDAKAAEKAFNDAMSDAQARMRPVSADATNPQTRSRYASYGKLDNALRPIYTDAGFSLSFDTDDSPKPEHVRVLCYVSHKEGHTRTYKADMPADGKGAKGNDVMTKTHAFGSGTSYGMRYLLKMIFNVAIGDEDDDGNAAGCTDAQDEKRAVINEWLEVVKECATVAELNARKKECVKAYGMVDKIPTAVRSAFVQREESLA